MHSAFSFENYNGTFMHFIKNAAKCVPEQIAKLYYRQKVIERKVELIFSRINCNPEGKKLF